MYPLLSPFKVSNNGQLHNLIYSLNNGRQLGASGEKYNNVCPTALETEFLRQYQLGLNSYCTPQKGFQLGEKGFDINEACSPSQYPEYHNEHRLGYKLFQIDKKEREILAKLKELDIAIYKLNQQSTDYEIKQKEMIREQELLQKEYDIWLEKKIELQTQSNYSSL